MPSIETMDRHQSAVYWQQVGKDAYANYQVSSPVDLDVKWENADFDTLDSQGNTVTVDAVLVVDRDIPIGSIVWRGTIEDLDDPDELPTSDLRRVVAFSKIPDIKNRYYRRVAYVTRLYERKPNYTIIAPTILQPEEGDIVPVVPVTPIAAVAANIPSPWTSLTRGGSPAGSLLTINPQGLTVDVSTGPNPAQFTVNPGGYSLFIADPELEIGNGATIETVTGANDVTDSAQLAGRAVQTSASPYVFSAGNASITWSSWVDFDGTYYVTLTITPSGGTLTFNLLRLTYHLRAASTTYLTCPHWQFSRGVVNVFPQTLEFSTDIGETENLYLNHGPLATPIPHNERGYEQMPMFHLHSVNEGGIAWWCESLHNWCLTKPAGSFPKPVWIRRISTVETELEITLVNKAISTTNTLTYHWALTPTPNRPLTANSTKFRLGTPARQDPITLRYNHTKPAGFTQISGVYSFGPTAPTWWSGLTSGLKSDGGKIRDKRPVHDNHWAGAGSSEKVVIDNDLSQGIRHARYASAQTLENTNTYMADNGGGAIWGRYRQQSGSFLSASTERLLCANATQHNVHLIDEVQNYVENFGDLYGALYTDTDQFWDGCDNPNHGPGITDQLGQGGIPHWPVLKMRETAFTIALLCQSAGLKWIRHAGGLHHPAVHSVGDYMIVGEDCNTHYFGKNITPAKTYADIPSGWWYAYRSMNIALLVISQLGRGAADHLSPENWNNNRQFFDAVVNHGLGFWGGRAALLNNWMSLAYWQREQEEAVGSVHNSVVASYRLDESVSTDNATDSNSSYTITLVGDPGVVGPGARSFDGATQYGYRTTPVPQAPGSFTIAARVNLSSASGTQTIIAHSDSARTDVSWILEWASNRFTFHVSRDGTTLQSVSTPATFSSTSVWYNVAAAYDATIGSSHICATSPTSGEFPVHKAGNAGNLKTSGADLSLAVTGGSGTKANYFNGQLDDIVWWRKVITPGEMLVWLDGEEI